MSNTNTFLGNSGITAIYLGNTPIVSAYCGTNLIFPQKNNYYELTISATSLTTKIISDKLYVKYYEVLENGVWVRYSIPTEAPPYYVEHTFSSTGEQTLRVYTTEYVGDTYTGIFSNRNNDMPDILSVTVHQDYVGADDFAGANLGDVYFDNTKRINESAFEGTNFTGTFTLPNTITYIGGHAFATSKLTSFVIPDTVTSIGGQPFYNCSELTHLVIGSGITSLSRAFVSGDKLEVLVIGESVTELYNGTLQSQNDRCIGVWNNKNTLSSITIKGDTFPTIGDKTFSSYILAPTGVISVPQVVMGGTSWLEYEPFKSNNWTIIYGQ